jgi:hypothetical protein
LRCERTRARAKLPRPSENELRVIGVARVWAESRTERLRQGYREVHLFDLKSDPRSVRPPDNWARPFLKRAEPDFSKKGRR